MEIVDEILARAVFLLVFAHNVPHLILFHVVSASCLLPAMLQNQDF